MFAFVWCRHQDGVHARTIAVPRSGQRSISSGFHRLIAALFAPESVYLHPFMGRLGVRIEYRRMPTGELRAARANRVFCADEKRIRTENTVLDKGNYGFGLVFYNIADCARTAFRPRQIASLEQPWDWIPAAGGNNCRRMPLQARKCTCFPLLIRTLPE